jgi:molecular chaperone GrpE (heat shock protein)
VAKTGLHLSLGQRRGCLGSNQESTIESTDKLATTLSKQGRYDEAQELHMEILEKRERALKKAIGDTLGTLDNMETFLRDAARHKDADMVNQCAEEAKERYQLEKDHSQDAYCRDKSWK